MVAPLCFFVLVSTSSGALDEALEATEPPRTLRAAFTVELTSDKASRVFDFDPRAPEGGRWRLVEAVGEDGDLDQAASIWGAEPAPDGRLFPDDLRPSFGQAVEVDDKGLAWQIDFRHRPSANDTEFDKWAIERLSASAWLDPATNRFLRLDYSLPAPVRGPEGGRLTKFDQSWFLETEPTYGLSVVTAFSIDVEARAGFKTITRGYSAQVTRAELFFSSDEAEAEFLSSQLDAPGQATSPR
ncbi:MAG: hypothetical protein AAFX03_11895 [Pseudomonadota bacterium]